MLLIMICTLEKMAITLIMISEQLVKNMLIHLLRALNLMLLTMTCTQDQMDITLILIIRALEVIN